MKNLLRLILVLALLPGLASGLLPLPGQAAGFEMVICGDTGAETIRVDAEGNPLPDDPMAECDQCCLACGPAPALLPDSPLRRPAAPRVLLVDLPAAGALALPARRPLFPAPRGPPTANEMI